MRISPLLVSAVLVASVPACMDDIPGTMCTASFAYVQVRVQTSSGTPIQGLSIADTVLRNQAGFTVPQFGATVPGMYVIMSDDFRTRLRNGGDSVRVTGHAGGAVFSTVYTFDVPDGCHVRKVSGPDVIQP